MSELDYGFALGDLVVLGKTRNGFVDPYTGITVRLVTRVGNDFGCTYDIRATGLEGEVDIWFTAGRLSLADRLVEAYETKAGVK